MNKISLKTVREILRDNELKNILGGSDGGSYRYIYCYDCAHYPDRKGTICSNNSMDYIYDTFADVCTSGGALYECSRSCYV